MKSRIDCRFIQNKIGHIPEGLIRNTRLGGEYYYDKNDKTK